MRVKNTINKNWSGSITIAVLFSLLVIPSMFQTDLSFIRNSFADTKNNIENAMVKGDLAAITSFYEGGGKLAHKLYQSDDATTPPLLFQIVAGNQSNIDKVFTLIKQYENADFSQLFTLYDECTSCLDETRHFVEKINATREEKRKTHLKKADEYSESHFQHEVIKQESYIKFFNETDPKKRAAFKKQHDIAAKEKEIAWKKFVQETDKAEDEALVNVSIQSVTITPLIVSIWNNNTLAIKWMLGLHQDAIKKGILKFDDGSTVTIVPKDEAKRKNVDPSIAALLNV